MDIFKQEKADRLKSALQSQQPIRTYFGYKLCGQRNKPRNSQVSNNETMVTSNGREVDATDIEQDKMCEIRNISAVKVGDWTSIKRHTSRQEACRDHVRTRRRHVGELIHAYFALILYYVNLYNFRT